MRRARYVRCGVCFVLGGRLVVTFGSSRPRRPLDVAVHGGRHIARALAPWRAELRGPRRLTELAEASLPEPVEPAVAEWADAGSVTPRLRAALRDSGLVDIRASWFGREEPYETADELWEAQTTMVTPVRKRIAAAPADLVEELHRRFLTEANAVLARGGRLVYPVRDARALRERPHKRLGGLGRSAAQARHEPAADCAVMVEQEDGDR